MKREYLTTIKCELRKIKGNSNILTNYYKYSELIITIKGIEYYLTSLNNELYFKILLKEQNKNYIYIDIYKHTVMTLIGIQYDYISLELNLKEETFLLTPESNKELFYKLLIKEVIKK